MHVTVASERRWRIAPSWVARLLRFVAGRAPGLPRSTELSVALVGLKRSAELNRRYRRRNSPTNILSFHLAHRGSPLLGELILCPPRVADEAPQYGRTVREHAGRLLIHGFLHLRGFDHRATADRIRMERRERFLWKAWLQSHRS